MFSRAANRHHHLCIGHVNTLTAQGKKSRQYQANHIEWIQQTKINDKIDDNQTPPARGDRSIHSRDDASVAHTNRVHTADVR